METDSAPLDVLVVHDDGTVDTVELPGIMDVADPHAARGGAATADESGGRRAAAGAGDGAGADAAGPGWHLRMTLLVRVPASLIAVDERPAQAAAVIW